MEPNYQSDILKRLRELNAMISCHIAKTKKDVKLLEVLSPKSKTAKAVSVRAKLLGVRQLSRQWQEHAN